MRLSSLLKSAAVAGVLASAVGATEYLGDMEAGKVVFKQCKGCHQVGEGAENRIGPHLNLVFGRKAAGFGRFQVLQEPCARGELGSGMAL